MTQKDDLHELAGGWIRERKNTKIPVFLKLAYVGFCLFGLAYLFAYWRGELAHVSRGSLVRHLDAMMPAPGVGWQAVIAVLLAAFVVGLLRYAFTSRAEE
jgi:hypothetical protein